MIKSLVHQFLRYIVRLFPWRFFKYEVEVGKTFKGYTERVKCVTTSSFYSAFSAKFGGGTWHCNHCAFWSATQWRCRTKHKCVWDKREDRQNVVFLNRETYKKIFYEKHSIQGSKILPHSKGTDN